MWSVSNLTSARTLILRQLNPLLNPQLNPQLFQHARCLTTLPDIPHDGNKSRLKILIPSYYKAVQNLIGPNGKNIKKIAFKSKTKIKMSRFNDHFPGTRDRVLMVEGSKSNVIGAVGEINELLRNVELPSENLLAEEGLPDRKNTDKYKMLRRNLNGIRFVLPFSICGKLIGPGGANVSKLQTEHCLNIHSFAHLEQAHVDLNETFVSFQGEKENLQKASEMVLDCLDIKTRHTLSDNFSYQEFNKQPKLPLNFRTKILIPGYAVGTFFEHGAKSVHDVMSELKCHIKVSSPGNEFPGTIDAVILIEGRKENFAKVARKVRKTQEIVKIPEAFRDKEWAENRCRELRILVPLDWGTCLIANNGEKMKDIMEMHSLEKMNFDKRRSGNPKSSLKEAILIMRGDEENVLKAVDMIFEMMLADRKGFATNSSMNYHRFHKEKHKPLWYFQLPDELLNL